jgi:hypothetical protein
MFFSAVSCTGSFLLSLSFPRMDLLLQRGQIVLAGADETRQHVLLLGRLNPVGNAVYARWLDDKEVLLVGSYLLTALDVVFERLRSSSHAEIATDASCEEIKTVIQ